VAGLLFVVEFVADKIPYLDNVWDAVHTVIRPLGAAAVGAVLVGDATSVVTAVSAVVAGGLALNAHAAKASTRLAVNTSPEPVSNVALSLIEDVSVAALMALALSYPVVTVIVVVALVVSAGALTFWLFRTLRRMWRKIFDRLKGRRSAHEGRGAGTSDRAPDSAG
ncbi:MAG: DUF4126 family protein, partial [Proteobacteria bacterium]|nr:DUF4126 family protein [Pseudomonadota bacterium]